MAAVDVQKGVRNAGIGGGMGEGHAIWGGEW